MRRKTGSADLPLHGGRVPDWLARRMAELGRVVVEALVLECGREEVLRRLAQPFWFQALGAVMGMDWHSSGITTSVVGALRRDLAPVTDDLGLYVCGGCGRAGRRTPEELRTLAGSAGPRWGRARLGEPPRRQGGWCGPAGRLSNLSPRVRPRRRRTVGGHPAGDVPGPRARRRYHWLSEGLRSFVEDPQAAIEGEGQGEVVNLADVRAARARADILRLAKTGPERAVARRSSRAIIPPITAASFRL